MNLPALPPDKPVFGDIPRITGDMMKAVVLTALGTVVGLILGIALGILAGIAWVSIFKTSDFEGYSAMLVFFTFAPSGAVLGGLIGAIWAAYAASRARIRMEGDA
jgi:Na+/glutamate symporter